MQLYGTGNDAGKLRRGEEQAHMYEPVVWP